MSIVDQVASRRAVVVDDDDQVRALVAEVLQLDGWEVVQAADGVSAMAALRAEPAPDLVILDVLLPGGDGRDILRAVRATADVPVILLTGMGAEQDRIRGLDLGADDYVTKPFSPPELAARVRSVVRRTQRGAPTHELRFDGLVIDLASRELRVDDELVETTAKEFALLAFLAASPRQVFSRDQLLRQVWESSADWQDPATVTEHVRRLRRKIEKDPDDPRWVVTVRGVGYRFEP